MTQTKKAMITNLSQNDKLIINEINFENNLESLLNIIKKNRHFFVSSQSDNMKYINELEKRNLIRTSITMFGKICNSLI